MWHLKGEALDVQDTALRRSHGRKGYGFYMEMGLGKTACVLNESIDLVKKGDIDQIIVLAPSTLLDNWGEEAKKFDYPYPVSIWPKKIGNEGPALQMMNYEATIHSGGEFLDELVSTRNIYLAADESIQIKNHRAARTKRGIIIAQLCPVRRILSGKPMVQGPHDLWSQLRFIGELSGFNYFAFRNTFCKMGGYMNKQVIGDTNPDKLAEILNSCTFQALKKDWTDLPPKMYETLHPVMTKKQRDIYNVMAEDAFMVIKGNEVSPEMVISLIIKLQQITSGFVIDDDGNTHQLIEPRKVPKIAALLEFMGWVSGKLIVFCHYSHSRKVIMKLLKEDGYEPAMIAGKAEMKNDELRENKRRFNEDPNCRVLVSGLKPGKYGHTLLGGEGKNQCSTSMFYENNYSLDDRSQAEDRNHRHGQTGDNVTYIDMVCSDIDSRIIKALQRKEDMVTAIQKLAIENQS